MAVYHHSSQGTANDVAPDVKAFLDYINGLPIADDFINSNLTIHCPRSAMYTSYFVEFMFCL
ncbi:MAG: hypothetical protein K6F01_03805 [Selenomonas sp.]|nr:hypothetical protein [Selenomonas sp.]